MDTKFTVKNFRVFDKDGVTVNIKPITVLTGCNSSGKSSIVKSMVLLNTYIESLVEDFKAFKRIDLKSISWISLKTRLLIWEISLESYIRILMKRLSHLNTKFTR